MVLRKPHLMMEAIFTNIENVRHFFVTFPKFSKELLWTATSGCLYTSPQHIFEVAHHYV